MTLPDLSRGRFTALLCALTVIVSMSVAYAVTGSAFKDVNVRVLADWGGVTWSELTSGAIWSVATAQLVHVKSAHMFFNVFCLFCVGAFVERVAGGKLVLAVWLLAGGFATVISPVLIEPPYDVGTGASQAVLALGSFAAVLLSKAQHRSALSISVTCLALVPPFLIDLAFAGYPKPGHLAGLLFGAMMGGAWIASHINRRPAP